MKLILEINLCGQGTCEGDKRATQTNDVVTQKCVELTQKSVAPKAVLDGVEGALQAVFGDSSGLGYKLKEQPPVDAVPVVRCRDCEFNVGSSCDYSVVWLRPNGYCNWGRRREEDE